MRGLLTVFALETRALVRSGTFAILLVLSLGWMFVAPHLFTGDGTAIGAREMALRYSLGGVAALLAVAMAMSAAGAISGERTAKRLQLTMIRPVPLVLIALGKIAAYVLCTAIVLGAVTAVEAFRRPAEPNCRHVLKPVLPSVAEEAREMYDRFMKDPNTPKAAREAKKSVVLRLLANKAMERFEPIATNGVAAWRFPTAAALPPGVVPTARFKFSTDFGMRTEVAGEIAFGKHGTDFARTTQTVLEFPLTNDVSGTSGVLTLHNTGKASVLLRPRRDVELLLPADGFRANLVRAALELLAILTLLIAFAVFLGAGLGRPVAMFVAIATIALAEMSPAISEDYADALETSRSDAIGLAIVRTTETVTHPFGNQEPLEQLSLDECVEPREVMRLLLLDFVLMPLVFALLSALVLRRRS